MTTTPVEGIESRILIVRGHRVMLSGDLAQLYGVPVRALVQAVKRNIERFPGDFMFQMTWAGVKSLRSRFVILKRGQHLKYPPYAFTEQGVAMLSSVLRSKRAVLVNVEIMRAFVRLRKFLAGRRDWARELERLERRCDSRYKTVCDAIRELARLPEEPRRRIGFHPQDRRSGLGPKAARL